MDRAFEEWTKLRAGFERIKSYLPPSDDLTLAGLQDASSLDQPFKVLGDLLSAKEANIRNKAQESSFGNSRSSFEQYQFQLQATAAANATPILEINKRKNDVRGQKLGIKKELCISRLFKLREQYATKVSRLSSLDSEIQAFSDDIRQKEEPKQTRQKAGSSASSRLAARVVFR